MAFSVHVPDVFSDVDGCDRRSDNGGDGHHINNITNINAPPGTIDVPRDL